MDALVRWRAARHQVGRGDRGAALVEFALVVPVLAVLLFGTITGGLALNQQQQITHATREGARYAASVPANQTFVAGTWAENVRGVVVERSAGHLESAGVCVSLVQGNPGTVVAPAASHSTAVGAAPCIANQSYPVTATDSGLRVQVTGARESEIELGPAGQIPVTLSGQATARSELPL